MAYALKPMENVFINIVGKLVDELHQKASSDDEKQAIVTKLNQHLDKAKRHQMQVYEAEVYNALGMYHIRQASPPDTTLEYFQLGHDLAEKTNNTDLLMRILNAIGSIWMIKHDYEKARSYYQQIIDVSASSETPSLYVTFAYLNLVGDYARQGQWMLVRQHLDDFDETVNQLTVTSKSRQNYGRVIYYAYIIKIQMALALGEDTLAYENLRLVKELANQLKAVDAERYLIPLEALCDLIVQDNASAFEMWLQNAIDNQTLTILDGSIIASVLNSRNKAEMATKLALVILALAPDDLVKARLQDNLEKIGVEI